MKKKSMYDDKNHSIQDKKVSPPTPSSPVAHPSVRRTRAGIGDTKYDAYTNTNTLFIQIYYNVAADKTRSRRENLRPRTIVQGSNQHNTRTRLYYSSTVYYYRYKCCFGINKTRPSLLILLLLYALCERRTSILTYLSCQGKFDLQRCRTPLLSCGVTSPLVCKASIQTISLSFSFWGSSSASHLLSNYLSWKKNQQNSRLTSYVTPTRPIFLPQGIDTLKRFLVHRSPPPAPTSPTPARLTRIGRCKRKNRLALQQGRGQPICAARMVSSGAGHQGEE